MQQTQFNFSTNKLNYFTGLDDLTWAYRIKKEKDKQFKKDVKWIMDLIDKYSK